jgi:DNA-binding IclR family transcriptional regulator
MSTSAIGKGLRILEILTDSPAGMTVVDIAIKLKIPKTATQNVLRSLESIGFVRTHSKPIRYVLTMKLAGMSMTYVARSGISEVYQPILDRLASETGELIRMTLVIAGQLTWVGMSQGSRKGLRIAPDTGHEVCLHATAAGKAWLATMTLEQAMKLLLNQGFSNPDDLGRNAVLSVEGMIEALKRPRKLGYSLSIEEYIQGMAAVAAPIPAGLACNEVIGTLSIAGPMARMDEATLRSMVPKLKAATAELSILAPIIAIQSSG